MIKPKPAASLSDAVTIRWETSLGDEEWSFLAERVRPAMRFLAHGWWQAWGDAMLPHGNWRGPLRFAVARSSNDVVQAVLPCAQQMMLGLSVLSLAGNYKPFRSWLIADDAPPETTSAVVRFFTREAGAKALRLGPVEATQVEIQTLKQALADTGWRFCRINRGDSHLIALPENLAAYKAMVGSKKFQRLGYQERRMGREGDVRIACYRDLDPEGWQSALSDAASVEQASWLVGQGGDLAYADPQQSAFWQRCLANASASKGKSLWIIYVNDRPVSFNATMDSGDHRYGLSGHYDEAFKTYSPGKIAELNVIVDCFDHGIKLFHLGQGDGGSKGHLGANSVEPLEDWLALPPTAAGRLLYLAARAKFGDTA